MHPQCELLAVNCDHDTLLDDQGAFIGRSGSDIAIATVTGGAGIGGLLFCSKRMPDRWGLGKGGLNKNIVFSESLLERREVPTAQPSA